MKLEDLNDENWRKEKEQFGIKIGQVIKEARQSRELTQQEVTERAGFYRTYLGLIENGKYSPSVFTVWRIAKAMNMKLTDLLKDF